MPLPADIDQEPTTTCIYNIDNFFDNIQGCLNLTLVLVFCAIYYNCFMFCYVKIHWYQLFLQKI